MFWIALLLAQAAVPSQTDRGEAVFFEAQKGCASCHSLKGRGTAVGPDLTNIGRLQPAAIAMGIRSTATQYVQTVKLKTGEQFPAMPGPKDAQNLKLYDLSKMPPELHNVAASEVASMTPNDKWRHPPGQAGYTNGQIADVVAYIRYVASGSRKQVDPDEVR